MQGLIPPFSTSLGPQPAKPCFSEFAKLPSASRTDQLAIHASAARIAAESWLFHRFRVETLGNPAIQNSRELVVSHSASLAELPSTGTGSPIGPLRIPAQSPFSLYLQSQQSQARVDGIGDRRERNCPVPGFCAKSPFVPRNYLTLSEILKYKTCRREIPHL